jgi:peptide chain release factor 1
VTVAVLGPERAGPSAAFLESDVEVCWFGGTTGAGGQHRNKHENAARLTHRPTGLVRTAQTKSRRASMALAMDALRNAVARQEDGLAAERANVDRRAQIGSAAKADKRRTYRFQDDAVTDHLTGRRARLSDVMAGGFDRLWR